MMLGERVTDWPDDADGDALRRIRNDGVDLSVEHLVDFQIDFDSWPPDEAALDLLRERYSVVEVCPPEEGDDGYVEVSLEMILGYDEVVGMQQTLSSLLAPYGGRCDAWGMWRG